MTNEIIQTNPASEFITRLNNVNAEEQRGSTFIKLRDYAKAYASGLIDQAGEISSFAREKIDSLRQEDPTKTNPYIIDLMVGDILRSLGYINHTATQQVIAEKVSDGSSHVSGVAVDILTERAEIIYPETVSHISKTLGESHSTTIALKRRQMVIKMQAESLPKA
jgi:hypothetical protein